MSENLLQKLRMTAAGLENQKLSKDDVKIPFRNGERNKDAEIDFLAIVMNEVVKEFGTEITTKEGKKETFITRDQMIDVLFFSKAATLDKSIKEIEWYSNPIKPYASSKVTVNNIDRMKWAECLRKRIDFYIAKLATSEKERNYKASWGDLFRVPVVSKSLKPYLPCVLNSEDSTGRNLAFSHGYHSMVSFDESMTTFINANMLILKKFSLCRDLFQRTTKPMRGGGNITIWVPLNVGQVEVRLKSGMDLKRLVDVDPTKEYSMKAVTDWGMHISALRPLENPVFKNPNKIMERGEAQDNYVAAVGIYVATVNKILGTSFAIQSWDEIQEEKRGAKQKRTPVYLTIAKEIMQMKKAMVQITNPRKAFGAPVPYMGKGRAIDVTALF